MRERKHERGKGRRKKKENNLKSQNTTTGPCLRPRIKIRNKDKFIKTLFNGNVQC
jgi:hypothetical protein